MCGPCLRSFAETSYGCEFFIVDKGSGQISMNNILCPIPKCGKFIRQDMVKNCFANEELDFFQELALNKLNDETGRKV